MIEQLEKLEKRYEELEHLLGSQEIASDRNSYNKYGKELADLSQAVSLFRRYKET